jgi:hypothetical protein
MAHYHDPPVTGHVHGIYARDSFFFVAKEKLAVRHQPIPYPWCWSSCIMCFLLQFLLPLACVSIPCPSPSSPCLVIVAGWLRYCSPLALVVELYDTGHLFQGEPGFISFVKTQANPLGGWWTMPGCRWSLSGGSRCTASRSWCFGSSSGIVF